MQSVRDMVNGPIMPTPGAVMQASKMLYEEIEDLMTIDVGGATTDVHSVTEGSDNISRILINPEPVAKRTVEGDLGLYISMPNVVEMVGKEEISKKIGISMGELENIIDHHKSIPKTDIDIKFAEVLAYYAMITAVKRHAGTIRYLYGPSGKKTVAEGKDLTKVKYIIGTGGALTRLPNKTNIMESIPKNNKGNELLPSDAVKILVDNSYIMASLGVLSKEHPNAALKLMKNSLEI